MDFHSLFFVRELEFPFVDFVLYDIFETPTCINCGTYSKFFPISSLLLRIWWSLGKVINFSFTRKLNISSVFTTSKVY